MIQIEEPTIHFIACYYPEQTELLDFLVDGFNREVEGLDDVELWIHTCWGNPNMQKVFTDESYANSIEIYLERLKGDVWTIEATENDLEELDLFKPYARLAQEEGRGRRGQPPHAAGRHGAGRRRPGPARAGGDPGRQADPLDRLRLRAAGLQPDLAFYKATAIAQARNIVLKELGVEERYVPAADPRLAGRRAARRRAADAPAVALEVVATGSPRRARACST